MNMISKQFKVTDGLLEALWLLGYVDIYTVLKAKFFDEEWQEDCYIIEIKASKPVMDKAIELAKADVPFGTTRVKEVHI